MTILTDAVKGLQRALALSDRVEHLGRRCDDIAEAMGDLSHELREYDRRITRLEASWETAVLLSGAGGAPRRLEGKD